jgi:riboflavin transporter FmnP
MMFPKAMLLNFLLAYPVYVVLTSLATEDKLPLVSQVCFGLVSFALALVLARAIVKE